MNYEIVTLQEQIAVGIAARTNNASPDMGKVIGALWSRFYSGGVYASIAHKWNEKALGIYTDYAEDEKSDYTVLAACAVLDLEAPRDIPLTICKIPAGRYAKFAVTGNVRTAVAEAWQEIWAMNLPRSFVCDFEEYQNGDMENAQIHLYIGLKEEA